MDANLYENEHYLYYKTFKNTHTQAHTYTHKPSLSQSWPPHHNKLQANYYLSCDTAKIKCSIKIYDTFNEVKILGEKKN